MKAAELKQQQDDDLRRLLADASGRRLFWRLLVQSGLYSSSYAESPHATAYNEGRRSVAVALLTEAQRVAPGEYLLSVKEQAEAAALAELERKKPRPETE